MGLDLNIKRVFLDTDVLWDFFSGSGDRLQVAGMMFSMAESYKLTLIASPLSFVILESAIKAPRSVIDEKLGKLAERIEISTVGKNEVLFALNKTFSDFEDAIQAKSALEAKADIIITRNIGHYKKSEIPTFTPVDFIQLMI